jgi:hypothetical protein
VEQRAPRLHIAFVDGKEQWYHRVSDLRRFIELFHQEIIDHLWSDATLKRNGRNCCARNSHELSSR